MKLSLLNVLAFLFAATLISGCADFNYTGRYFDAASDDAVISWYTAENPVPAGKFRVIGRGTLKFRHNALDKYDIEERLLEEARKIGADAVLLKKTVSTEVASYDTDSTKDKSKAVKREKQIGITADGSELEINDLTDTELKGNERSTADTTVYAVFYKKSEAVKKLIESQSVRMMQTDEEMK